MATYSSNTTLKFGGTVSGGGTVPANSYAIANYTLTSLSPNTSGISAPPVFQIYQSAGDTVQTTKSILVGVNSAGSQVTATYSLIATAVYFVNTP